MTESLDAMLEGLTSGDEAATERVYRAIEPHLLRVVRRMFPQMLRGKFDSADVIQSVWADTLCGLREERWHFEGIDQLRGFLYVATRNRLIQRIRRHGKMAARETGVSGVEHLRSLPSALPRPSEEAQAAEMWERLLEVCPPDHRPILELKRQGHGLAEIGARTGFHPDSVRRILRTLARKLVHTELEPASKDSTSCRD
jgi:RNA polymerase sigma-70 factor (ECF subfamily)